MASMKIFSFYSSIGLVDCYRCIVITLYIVYNILFARIYITYIYLIYYIQVEYCIYIKV